MEKEKKEIKISLGTFICLIIIAILVVAVIMMGLYITRDKKEINNNELGLNENVTGQTQNNNGNNNTTYNFVQNFSSKLDKLAAENTAICRNEWIVDDGEADIIKKAAKEKYEDGQLVKLSKETKAGQVSYWNTNQEGYAEQYNIINQGNMIDAYYIETTEDMQEAYIGFLYELEENTIYKVQPFMPYKIDGIDGKIKKVFMASEGHDTGGILQNIYILMENGTLKYVNCIEALLDTGIFTAYDCTNMGKVKDILQCHATYITYGETEGSGDWWIIEKEDGNYYTWCIVEETATIGNYTVSEIKFDEAGVSNEECGINLINNTDFYIYEGWGSGYSGIYEVENNKLICNVTKHEWDGGAGEGSEWVNITFIFDIIDNSQLKLCDIVNRDNHNIYPEGLTIGMMYSIK